MSRCLVAQVAAGEVEAAAGLLHLWGASGVEIRDGSGLPPPGAAAVASGRAELRAWFSGEAEAARAGEALAARLSAALRVEPVEDEVWAESWKRHFHPLSIGRFHVAPPWDSKAPPGRIPIVLEPGLAFGTGSHATTALCLRALGTLLAREPGASVLDVGTGSGILAIAAALGGAGRVAGSDVDPVALRVAHEGAERNGVGAAIELVPAGEEPDGPFQIVVANILANTLIDLAPRLSGRLAAGGTLLLSGLLHDQGPAVAKAFAGLHAAPPEIDAGWCLLTFRRPG